MTGWHPVKKKYLQAMAGFDSGTMRSKEIAAKLGKSITTAAPIRAKLIDKSMAYSPAHGDIAFTVPLFDEFLKRT